MDHFNLKYHPLTNKQCTFRLKTNLLFYFKKKKPIPYVPKIGIQF